MLSKNLAEKMVMLRDNKPSPVTIVRPSLIGSLSGLPCPVSLPCCFACQLDGCMVTLHHGQGSCALNT